MHRSGTSALSRVLFLLGGALPTRVLQAGSKSNPSGFWEDPEVVAINESLLAIAGSAWHDICALPTSWFRSDQARNYLPKMLDLLQRTYSDAPLIVLKDPRMCRLAPLWLSAIEQFGAQPAVVIAVRNPLEVAESLHLRDGFTRHKAMLLWLRHVLEAERDTRKVKRSMVHYNDLLGDWRAVVDRVARDFDIEWPYEPRTVRAEIDSFLSKSLRHHQFSLDDVMRSDDVPRWIKSTYQALHAPNGGRDTSGVLDRVASELISVDNLVGHLRRNDSVNRTIGPGEIERLYRNLAASDSRIWVGLTLALRHVERAGRCLVHFASRLRHCFWMCRHYMSAEPIAQERDNGHSCVGRGKRFRLISHRGYMPGGWATISFRIDGDTTSVARLLHAVQGGEAAEPSPIPLAVLGRLGATQTIFLPGRTESLFIDFADGLDSLSLSDIEIREIGTFQVLLRLAIRKRRMLWRALDYLRHHGLNATKYRIVQEVLQENDLYDYQFWIAQFDTLSEADREAIRCRKLQIPPRKRSTI